jgi:crotonobetainyl-CoA:carnitine CoA-transferase CaiB-like acyl-CoA transferase
MSETPKLPLAGIRVIEMGSVIAAPFCASLLADLGAEIIKIERPDGGDPFRGMSPRVHDVPLWWGVASRNKSCVSMDLKNPVDKRRFEILIAGADIFIENNRPGVLDRLGLGWDALSRINPGLIMLSISGYGQTGPAALRPGFGKIAEAMSGQVALTGDAAATPFHIGLSLADTATGLTGLFGVAVAMFARETLGDGRGAYVDVALYESLMRMLDCQFALTDALGAAPARQGTNNPYGWGVPAGEIPKIRSYRCADGAWLALLAGDDDKATEVEGMPIAAFIAARPAAVALQRLRQAGVEAVRVQDGASMAAEAYFLRRGDVVNSPHPIFGQLSVPGYVPHGYETSALRAVHTPEVGECDVMAFIVK